MLQFDHTRSSPIANIRGAGSVRRAHVHKKLRDIWDLDTNVCGSGLN